MQSKDPFLDQSYKIRAMKDQFDGKDNEQALLLIAVSSFISATPENHTLSVNAVKKVLDRANLALKQFSEKSNTPERDQLLETCSQIIRSRLDLFEQKKDLIAEVYHKQENGLKSQLDTTDSKNNVKGM